MVIKIFVIHQLQLNKLKRLILPLLAARALPISVNAETSNLTSGFIDLADSTAPDISDEESEEDTETTSENTEE